MFDFLFKFFTGYEDKHVPYKQGRANCDLEEENPPNSTYTPVIKESIVSRSEVIVPLIKEE
jgi:hypothetical protein